MNDTLCTVIVAGAWSYRVVVTDDILKDDHGRLSTGGCDPANAQLLLVEHQSADTALATLTHEFIHAWREHVNADRSALSTAVRALAKNDATLRRALEEGTVEAQATMVGCILNEFMRVDIKSILARRFGTFIIRDVRQFVAEVSADAIAAIEAREKELSTTTLTSVDTIRYVHDTVTNDWQRKCGQSGARCECPQCGHTINAATVAVGEPRISVVLRGRVCDCMFVCDVCGTGVRWKSAFPVPANFDSSLQHDVELLTGREAEDALTAILGPVVQPMRIGADDETT